MRFIALLAAGIALSLPAMAEAPKLAGGPAEQAAPTVLPGHEPGIYRFGATYSSFGARSAAACQSACTTQNACFAWSYLVGTGDAHARCELKRSGGQIERNPTATSGYSPTKERQRPPVRVIKQTQIAMLTDGSRVYPPGTVVTSRPIPLGDSPTITHTLRKPRYPMSPTSPSAKKSLRGTEK